MFISCSIISNLIEFKAIAERLFSLISWFGYLGYQTEYFVIVVVINLLLHLVFVMHLESGILMKL